MDIGVKLLNCSQVYFMSVIPRCVTIKLNIYFTLQFSEGAAKRKKGAHLPGSDDEDEEERIATSAGTSDNESATSTTSRKSKGQKEAEKKDDDAIAQVFMCLIQS